jgi:hypothetical protein
MRIYRRHEATIVESELLLKVAGFLSLGREGSRKAKAAAFFPFVFVRDEEFATPIFINHERIHFRQQLETLFVGLFLLHIFEDIFSGLFLKLSAEKRYLYRSAEQEAYRNQENLDYLENRKLFSQFKYLKDKRNLTFVEGEAPRVLAGEPF